MDRIEKFIKEKEYNIAFMEKVNLKQPKEYLQVMTLFANRKKVGYVIFGIHDKTKRIIGIEKVMKSYKEISKNMQAYINPNIESVIKIIHIEEKNIILVKIIPKRGKTYYFIAKDGIIEK